MTKNLNEKFMFMFLCTNTKRTNERMYMNAEMVCAVRYLEQTYVSSPLLRLDRLSSGV